MNIKSVFYKEDPTNKTFFSVLIAIGIIALAATFYLDATKAWINILTANFFFLSIGAFGLFILLLSNIVGASFVAPYRRFLETLASTIPYFGILMLTILLGAHTLYEWTHHDVVMHDPILSQKVAYLNLPFFSARMIFCILMWTVLSTIFISKSRAQDKDPNNAVAIAKSFVPFSAVGMVLFALTFCVASFDWLMSLEPHWFSTIYAVFAFSGMFITGLSALIIMMIYVQSKGYLKDEINENHYHDLGKLLFGFSTFWAYIWYSQYLLIWYANIPEEVEYFVLREHYGWNWLFWLNLIINWVLPFIILLPRQAKRNKTVVHRVSIIILLGQWLNMYILVAPKVMEHHKIFTPSIGWSEIFIAIGYAGLFGFITNKNLAKASLLPINCPYLEEGLALEQ